ncbi:hypothetical protein CEE37_14040 [candidate division LCP-89 bacterium B3_LCP]|uniref:Secretion system C-terminal sorting domain-containing protein n=1 Tax=candidate division LCP-89 bacterium B3_LCP TaxID=2012998 RepID=A0A532UQM4_UNCL8|nr:MAG: hypothetical protein CEE37_14040 [candidate division LCP-89 bacterium B3_LCP]
MFARTVKITIATILLSCLAVTISNAEPDTLWTKTFGGTGFEKGYSVQQTGDDGYIIAGYTFSFGAGNADVYLIKTDASGTEQWSQTYGDSLNDYGYSVQITSDDGYIIVGYTSSFGAGNAEVYLIKVDASGTEQWSQTYGEDNIWAEGNSVQQTIDGGYIIAGRTRLSSTEPSDVYLIKTNASGNELWSQTYGGSGEEEGESVQQTSDGGYIIAGRTRSFGPGAQAVYLIKTDSFGTEQWSQTFGGSSYDSGKSVKQTLDGGYIVVGETHPGPQDYDVYVIKTDASGDTLWTKTFGGGETEIGLSIQPTNDYGYIITGFTNSFGAGYADVWLIRMEPDIPPTYGTISGLITDSLDWAPVEGANVMATGGYHDPDGSDETGLYEIFVPPGLGYSVTAYRYGYETKTIPGINIEIGSWNPLDFELNPADPDLVITTLSPDPNPPVSTIEQGGTLWRHYQIIDDSTETPQGGIEIWVDYGEIIPEPSDVDGIVSIGIPSSDVGIGSVGETETFAITHLNGIYIPEGEQIEFDCEVTDRLYSRIWANNMFVNAGVSWVGVEVARGSEVELQECGGIGILGDSLLVKRQGRESGSLSWGVGTPVQVQIGPVQGGASAGLEGGIAVLTEDAYKFDHLIISDLEAVAQYILFADGNFGLLDATLIDLLAYLETWFTGQSTLDNAYRYDKKAIDVLRSAKGNAALGYITSQYDAGIGAAVNVGIEGHSILGYQCPSHVSECRLSGSLTAAANGAAFLNPYSSSIYTSEFTEKLNLGGGSAGVTLGLELATIWNLSPVYWKNYEFVFDWSYITGSIGTEEKTTYIIDGSDVYETLAQIGDLAESLNQILLSGDSTEIGNTTFDQILYNGFIALGELQESSINPPVVEYSTVSGEISEVSSFPLNLGVTITGEKTLSVKVGGGSTFKQHDRKVSERGSWYRGKHLPLEKYDDNPQVPILYPTVVDTILCKVPWYVKAAAYVLTFLSPFMDDSTYALGNGSSIYFSDNAWPQGVDELTVASWGWWGSDPGTLSSEIDERSRQIRARIRDDARSIYGMDYGIGGFYQFEPLGTALLDSVSLTIAYQDSEVVEIDESTLKMYWEDKENHRWSLVGGVVDEANNTVTAEIEELQVFTLAPTLPSGDFSLIPDPPSIPADSMTVCTVISTTIMNNDSTMVEDGTLFTVSSSTGEIITPDADTTETGIQVETVNGIIEFDLIAWSIAYDATVTATSFYGTAEADTVVDFTDDVVPAPPTLINVIDYGEEIDVQWLPNSESDLAGYKIYYDMDASGPPYEGIATIFGQPSPVLVGVDTMRTLTGMFADSTYYVALTAFDISGNESDYSNEMSPSPAGFNPNNTESIIPTEYSLDQNYPNPFNPYTTISFGLPKAGQVELTLYNILGQQVTRLIDGYRNAGYHEVTWDASTLASGIYFYRIEAGDFVSVGKMVLMK